MMLQDLADTIYLCNYVTNKFLQFDYVIMTGDLPPHDIWSQTRTDQITVIRTVVKMLRETFPNTPVFPSLGNHESAPVNRQLQLITAMAITTCTN